MVKGLRSPELIHLDLMHTYNASASQTFWKLRVPASVPFLFASMKVAVAASLVGAIVGELPTGAVAGIGAKLLAGVLLQPDHRDLVGAGRGLDRRRAAGHAGRPSSAGSSTARMGARPA